MNVSLTLRTIGITICFGVAACSSLDVSVTDSANAKAITGCNLAQDELNTATEKADEIITSFTQYVEETMGAPDQYGFSVAVSLCGQPVYSRGLGFSDLETQVPVNEDTKFRIGSVSKLLTAIALGQLFESGAVDFDKDVQDYVPTFPIKDHPVTVRQVAGHLGGIRHYNNEAEFLSAERYETVTDGLVIFQDDPLVAVPGEKYVYSSYGWSLLSAVVESASGETFLDYMQTNVFQPAQMHNTLADAPQKIIPNRTRFYSFDPESGTNHNSPFIDQSNKWAGGGFLSTPNDLLRLARSVRHNDLITGETLSILTTSQVNGAGKETGYGIGWRTSTTFQDWESDIFSKEIISHTRLVLGDTRFMGHGGSSVGGKTRFLMTRDTGKDVVIAAVSNNDAFPPYFTIPVLATFLSAIE